METEQLLVPLEEYLKAGIHIGTKFRSKDMSPFVYKIRPDGLSVLNVQEIDRRIGVAANFLAQYKPEDILVVCRRESGWSVVKLMNKYTGINVIAGRYPPGILTNIRLDTFIEAKLILVVDPIPDKNAVLDAAKVGIPVIALCDTNNDANSVDFVIPCNNKGKKSLGLIFWILTKLYMEKRNLGEFKESIETFSAE